MSGVASEQPDDPPKCGVDERTEVCVQNLQPLMMSLLTLANFNIDVFSVAIQRRGDGATHPVV